MKFGVYIKYQPGMPDDYMKIIERSCREELFTVIHKGYKITSAITKRTGLHMNDFVQGLETMVMTAYGYKAPRIAFAHNRKFKKHDT